MPEWCRGMMLEGWDPNTRHCACANCQEMLWPQYRGFNAVSHVHMCKWFWVVGLSVCHCAVCQSVTSTLFGSCSESGHLGCCPSTQIYSISVLDRGQKVACIFVEDLQRPKAHKAVSILRSQYFWVSVCISVSLVVSGFGQLLLKRSRYQTLCHALCCRLASPVWLSITSTQKLSIC